MNYRSRLKYNFLCAGYLCMLLFAPACGSTAGEKDHDHEEQHDDHDHDHEDNHDHEGAIVIDEEAAKTMGVVINDAAEEPFSEIIKTTGRIEPASSDIMTVTAKKSGIFTLAGGINKGQPISQGTSIGSISSKGIQGGDVNMAAMANLEAARREVDRLRPLREKGLVTAGEYNEAERVLKEAQALVAAPTGGSTVEGVSSPCSGTLVNLMVNSGEYVDVGTPIATVAKDSRLVLRADLPERHVASASTLKSASIRPAHSMDVFPLSDLEGKRITGDSYVTGENGYVPIYFSFRSNGVITPGAYCEVYLEGESRGKVLAVPRDALIEIQGTKYLYVVHDGHAYEKRAVRTGATDGKRVEITEGLKPGEKIVTSGASIVRMAEVSAVAPPAHNHTH